MTGADAPWNFGGNNEYPFLTFDGHSAATQTQRSDVIATPGDTQATVTWKVQGNTVGVTGWQFTYKTQAAGSWENWADVPVFNCKYSVTYRYITDKRYPRTSLRFGRNKVAVQPVRRVQWWWLRYLTQTFLLLTLIVTITILLKITTLAQFNAMRYDLNGDGISDGPEANKILYQQCL